MSRASGSPNTVGQVLAFDLGPDVYCVGIEYVTEVVDTGELTAAPNAPPHVEGLEDLRGDTTTIVDPKAFLGLRNDGSGQRIVVFDPDTFEEERSIGWLVDGVREVTHVSGEELDGSPVDEYAKGLITRESGLVVWVQPRELQA